MDFVITWVKDSDPDWQEEYLKYKKEDNEGTDTVRFREWNNLRFWFRGVEEFAPWVEKIHFVTWGHLPDWLDTDHPKLNIVNHKSFIPDKYLPTFNSHTIELNFHRIKDLSEEYVYFNDDMFLLNPVREDYFFKNGKPCDMAVLDALPGTVPFYTSLFTNLRVINRHFKKAKTLKEKPFKWFNRRYGKNNIIENLGLAYIRRAYFTGFKTYHLQQASLKSTLKEIWKKEYEVMNESCEQTFRDYTTVNPYIQRYWDLASNNFHPFNLQKHGKLFQITERNLKEVQDFMTDKNNHFVCLNDDPELEDFKSAKSQINATFKGILPKKSSFEL